MRLSRPIALYVHIPFCQRKCAYCDFNSYAGSRDEEHRLYVAALLAEMEQWAARLASLDGQPVTVPSVFVGGGTPTLLSTPLLTRVIQRALELFTLAPDCEVTIEANPGTVDIGDGKLAAARSAGASRVSFGVQAFQNHLLATLGRVHTAQQAAAAVAAARAAGFTNLNLDLMYGLPGQTAAEFADSLSAAVALGPEHISAYGLIVEEGTPFHRLWQRQELHLPDEEAEEAMDSLATRILAAAGYERYEISNFARIGFQSRHNQVYWRNEEYIGLGCGAHSFLQIGPGQARRFWNLRSPSDYQTALQAGGNPGAGGEDLDLAGQMAETMMLGLRLLAGVSEERFRQRFGRRLDDVYGRVGRRLERRGLLDCSDGRWRLTPRGLRLGNQVWAEFLP